MRIESLRRLTCLTFPNHTRPRTCSPPCLYNNNTKLPEGLSRHISPRNPLPPSHTYHSNSLTTPRRNSDPTNSILSLHNVFNFPNPRSSVHPAPLSSSTHAGIVVQQYQQLCLPEHEQPVVAVRTVTHLGTAALALCPTALRAILQRPRPAASPAATGAVPGTTEPNAAAELRLPTKSRGRGPHGGRDEELAE